jgi:hypothetical protein
MGLLPYFKRKNKSGPSVAEPGLQERTISMFPGKGHSQQHQAGDESPHRPAVSAKSFSALPANLASLVRALLAPDPCRRLARGRLASFHSVPLLRARLPAPD